MKKFLIAVLCLFFLSGCAVKLAYNFMGFIVNWHIGKYVSLNSGQQQFVDRELSEFHDWHRKTQLPLYANYVSGLTHRIQKDTLTAAWVHKETDTVQDLLDLSVNKIKPEIVGLMSTFTEDQVTEVMKNLAETREKYRKKYIDISDKKRYNKRRDEIYDRLGPFFGSFSAEQKQWIEAWSRQLEPYEALTSQQQSLWADAVKAALDQRKNPAELSKQLDQIMFYRTDDWDPELEKILDKNQQLTYELIAKLLDSQSEKQRAKLLHKLTSYREDFLALSGSP